MSSLEESAMAAIAAGRHLAEAWHSASIWPSSLDRRKFRTLLTALEDRDPVDLTWATRSMQCGSTRCARSTRSGPISVLCSPAVNTSKNILGYSSDMEPAVRVFEALSRFKAVWNTYLDRVAVERTIAALGIQA